MGFQKTASGQRRCWCSANYALINSDSYASNNCDAHSCKCFFGQILSWPEHSSQSGRVCHDRRIQMTFKATHVIAVHSERQPYASLDCEIVHHPNKPSEVVFNSHHTRQTAKPLRFCFKKHSQRRLRCEAGTDGCLRDKQRVFCLAFCFFPGWDAKVVQFIRGQVSFIKANYRTRMTLARRRGTFTAS